MIASKALWNINVFCDSCLQVFLLSCTQLYVRAVILGEKNRDLNAFLDTGMQ